jgi:serine/threonine protein kinase
MGQYVLGKVIGHGGFGITYVGWDKHLLRKLAVKEYFPAGIAMRGGVTTAVTPFNSQQQKDYDYGLDRYLDEARMVAKFNHHPNILSVLNFFRENGTAYIVMEFLDGVTLEKHLEQMGGKISFAEAMTLLTPVMEALEEVHEAGVLHRDVSPDNIHVGARQVKLLDFGAARVALGERSRNLSVILKEGFAPSEQYRSKGNQGPWTDVYALAATMYRATTGVMPPAALDRMMEDELQPPRTLKVEMNEAQEAAVIKALAFDPRDRWQSMKEFREALLGRIDSPPAPVLELPANLTGPASAEVATVRSGPVPSTSYQPPMTDAAPIVIPEPKPKVPVWVWSVLGAVVVLGVLIGLRPKPAEPTAVVPSPAPVAAKAETAVQPVVSYDDSLRRAEQAANPAEGIKILEQTIAAVPARPEAHDVMGQILFYKSNDAARAAASFGKALELGGFVTFAVDHLRKDGTRGQGKLRLGRESLSFVDAEALYTFTTRKDDVALISAKDAAIDVQLKSGESYRFSGKTKANAEEAQLIARLAGAK